MYKIMKKNHSRYGEVETYIPFNFFRKMKITLIVVLLSTVQIFANGVYSQNARFTLVKDNVTIENVLGTIEGQSEYYFLYNGKLVDVTQKISIKVENLNLEETLNELFRDTNIAYRIYDRQVVLSPTESFNFSQQQKTVSGKVSDSSGTSLPGVSVVVKGTTNGTITDANGKYSLTNIPANSTLQFSFVGMKTQEIGIVGKTSINVVLQEERTIGIEEVIAVGYGTMKKSDLTGSLGNITAKEIENLPGANLLGAIQGKISGLTINSTNYAPGTDPEIIIRGYNSLSSSNTPLIILDGIPFDGGITQINPNDIQSFDVLKDASSTAIYGSRGSNGVILITTKSGKKGKPVIQYQGSVGVSSQAKKIDVLDRAGYIKLRQDIAKINGATDFTPSKLVNTDELEALNNGTSVDWQDLASRDAIQQDHQLSISGANENVNYYISVGHIDQDGILKGKSV